MYQLSNDLITLTLSADAAQVQDRTRNCVWEMRAADLVYFPHGAEAPRPLGDGIVGQAGDTLTVQYTVPEGVITYTWRLHEDHLAVTMTLDTKQIHWIALPGRFHGMGPVEIAVPLYQGALIRPRGTQWEHTVGHCGHFAFSMGMGAYLGANGGLLIAHESPCNWNATFGEDGDLYFRFNHFRCPVDGWVDATVRLYVTPPDLTAACKQYRTMMQQRGLFTTWEEKIARKPILENLFGALIAFVGYNKTPEIDYVASARQLKSYGFPRVFFYSTRMCQYSLDFLMGGDTPIWLSNQEMADLHALGGVFLAPWGWVVEGLDDGSQAMRHRYMHNEHGQVPGWKIDDYQWYWVCTPYQLDYIKERFAGDMRAMDWIHFDVNAMIPGRACLNHSHELHGNAPMSAREDHRWTQRLFSPDTVGNRVVSSEGFSDHYAAHYDLGSTKMMPCWDIPGHAIPVPMTMLVFHDSCIHDWWEVHNYNAHAGFTINNLPGDLGRVGCGLPRLKAAQDALYGCPPNLFPFGKQYGWVNIETRESFSYLNKLDDAPVQEAIQAAVPVAQLHARIGKCEMTAFALLSDDGAVQTTTFSDGTRIVANLADESREVTGYGLLPAQSWVARGNRDVSP